MNASLGTTGNSFKLRAFSMCNDMLEVILTEVQVVILGVFAARM
jgi:hypothetical protein